MQNKIDRKYYVWIWLGLIFANYIRNVYGIYQDINVLIGEASRTQIVADVFIMIFSYGVIPAVETFVFTLILYYITARRHSNYVSRTDFCYIVMTFVAGERAVAGLIDAFSILSANMHIVTATVLDVLLLPGAMLLMFFLMAKHYKFNVVEKRNSFTVMSVAFFVVLGLIVFSNNFTIVFLGSGGEYSKELIEYLRQMGYSVNALTSTIQVYSSISAIVIYIAYLIADIVIASLMKKNASEYQDEDTREAFFAKHPGARAGAPYTRRDDVDSTFEEFEKQHTDKKGDDDHVFDEFDI